MDPQKLRQEFCST